MSFNHMEDNQIILSDNSFQLTYMKYNPNIYHETISKKIESLYAIIHNHHIVSAQLNKDRQIEIHQSPTLHYRHRCRFALLKKIEFGLKSENHDDLCYVMWEEGEPKVRIGMM